MSAQMFSVGKSKLSDSKKAGADAASQALEQFKSSKAKLALVFATASYDQKELLKGIKDIVGNIPLIGCSGEGIITYGAGSDESGFAVGVMLFKEDDSTSIETFKSKGLKKDSTKCGKEIAKSVLKEYQGNNALLLIFADSMTINTTHVLKIFNKEFLKKDILVLGGTAGDMMKFKKTYQYFNGDVYEDTIVALLFQGNFDLEWMVSHGCQSVGLKQIVTASCENSLQEVDGKPTWEEFRGYLPDNPKDFKAEDAFHLCVGELYVDEETKKEELIIRMPVGMDKKTGAVQFSTEIPKNTTIHFTRRDPNVIAIKAIESFKALLDQNKKKEILAVFQFDCAGRGRVIYGESLNQMVIKPLQEMIGKEVPWIGFHTYGEIAPLKPNLIPVFFHNFTIVLGIVFKK